MQSRYYDPAMHRFLSMDDPSVLGVDQGSVIQYNLFAYCLNDPVNMVDPSGDFALRADLIADAIDFIIFLIPVISAINKGVQALRGTGQTIKVYSMLKPAITKIQVESAKYLTRLGIKLNIAGGILAIVNYLAKASGLLDRYFPFGLSIGGVVALALSKVFPTYTKYERKWGGFGPYGTYTYIKFW